LRWHHRRYHRHWHRQHRLRHRLQRLRRRPCYGVGVDRKKVVDGAVAAAAAVAAGAAGTVVAAVAAGAAGINRSGANFYPYLPKRAFTECFTGARCLDRCVHRLTNTNPRRLKFQSIPRSSYRHPSTHVEANDSHRIHHVHDARAAASRSLLAAGEEVGANLPRGGDLERVCRVNGILGGHSSMLWALISSSFSVIEFRVFRLVSYRPCFRSTGYVS
jgi:hypothetical protein